MSYNDQLLILLTIYADKGVITLLTMDQINYYFKYFRILFGYSKAIGELDYFREDDKK